MNQSLFLKIIHENSDQYGKGNMVTPLWGKKGRSVKRVSRRLEMLQNARMQEEESTCKEPSATQNAEGDTLAERSRALCHPNAIVNRWVQIRRLIPQGDEMGSNAQPASFCLSHPHCLLCGPAVGNPQRLWLTRGQPTPPGNPYQWANYLEKHKQKNRDSYKTCQMRNCCFCRLHKSQTSVMTLNLMWTTRKDQYLTALKEETVSIGQIATEH